MNIKIIYNIFLVVIFILILFLFSYFVEKKKKMENFNLIQQRNCFSQRLNKSEFDCFIQLIKIVDNILKRNNIKWIPVGGNLLSLYRQNQIIMKWDDDFDIVTDKPMKAVNVLSNELSKYNCKIIPFMPWKKSGFLYKIFFKPDIDNPCSKISITHLRKGKLYNYPFIDLFVHTEIENDECLWAHDLQKNELPLHQIKMHDMIISYPSKGTRSRKNFRDNGLFDICIDTDWSHKYEKYISCIGSKMRKCKDIKF